MKAALIKQTIKALFPIQRTLCIEGAPGGGKTTIVHEAAKELGVECRELHMPTMLVEDFGILFPCEGSNKLHYKVPEWFPDADDPATPEKGILLFDDRNQATPDLQKVLANICQARTLHGHRLPDGWMVISTGNRMSDRAGANRVLSHLRNRETVVEFETDVDDWIDWAAKNGVKPEVIAYIKFRPDMLHPFDPAAAQNPTPRSWVEGVSAVLGIVPKDAEADCFKGAVGEAAMLEFCGFLKVYRELPDLDDILKAPDMARIPQELSAKYAITAALAYRASNDTFDAHVTYLERIASEYTVLYMKMAYSLGKNVDKASRNAEMIRKYSAVILGIR